MNNSIYRFTLDLQKHQSQMSIAVFQYDNAVRLCISLTDGGKPYFIKDGGYAVFYAKRADNEPLAHYCRIKDNTEIIYDFEGTTACVSGIVDCQIRLYGTNKQLISAPKFCIVVDDRVVSDTDFEIDENTLSAFDEIFYTENKRIEAEKARDWAENGRFDADGNLLVPGRVQAEEERKSAWVRYSAYHDGTDYTESWSEGQNYIGVATSHDCPTDKSGYVWSLFKGEKGDKGKQGDKGEKGETGDPFRIAKVYSSVASMNADFSNTAIPEGSFVAIETGNVNHPDNAKLYLKGETAFTFITDLSGAQGLRGEKGEKGDPGDVGRLPEDLILWAFSSNGSRGLKYTFYSDYVVCSGIDTDICKETDIEIGSLAKGLPVTSISQEAFYECDSLTSVTIPDSVTNIGFAAFCLCTNLKSATIGNGVTSIPQQAFLWCDNLNSVAIGESVTTIEHQAFFDCPKLPIITIPKSVTTIEDDAFAGCNSLNIIRYRGTEAEWNAIRIGSGNERLRTATKTYNYGG